MVDMNEQNQTQNGAPINDQMRATQQTIHTWIVTSERNGSQTGHVVNLRELTCTCEDMQYNRDGHSVCDHILKANKVADPRMDPQTAINKDLHTMVVELKDMVDDLQQQKTAVKAEVAAATSKTTTQDNQTESETAEGATDDSGVAPNKAAGELDLAYQDAGIEDMQVKYTDNYVWVQTGQDTPDTLPGPGNVETFEALLQNPEQTHYIPDDYSGPLDNAAEEKPGEWWKNALEPEDVDEYINEVLD